MRLLLALLFCSCSLFAQVTSVQEPQSVSVLNGTAFGSIQFPLTVRATYSNGVINDLPVSFAIGSYDSSTDGLYTLTGTVSGTSITTTIDVWVLPAPVQWYDLIAPGQHEYGVDNRNRIITASRSKVGNDITQATANLVNRPSWNGDGVYFNTQGAMTWGTTSSHNRFHQDLSWSIFVVWYQNAVANTHYGPLLCSNGGTSTQTGIMLAVDNRIASSNTYAVNFFVSKSSAGNLPINVTTADNVVDPDAWNWAELKFDGTDFTLIVNGSVEATQTPSIAFSAGNATNALQLGNLPSVGASTGMNGYLKHVYMEDSFVSGATETLLQSWATAMASEGIVPEDANIYLMWGQSNMSGRGTYATTASDLLGFNGSRIAILQPTPPTQTDGSGSIDSRVYMEELQLNRNQTFETPSTQHGMEMRFAREMWDYNQNCWIIKMGVGGTPVYSTATYNDWNVSSAQLYTLYRALILNVVPKIQHVHRKNPVFRGMIIMQGETDAIITGAGSVYKTNMTTTINTLITTTVSAGYTINKLRLYIFRITDAGGVAYDPTEYPLIRTAQEDIGDDYLTDNPSMSSNVLGSTWRTTDDGTFLDTQHYDSAFLDIMGQALFDYFKQYTTE